MFGNTATSSYIEAVDDDAYLRRHGKPEAEEKRRKRWDMQRIREQRNTERLKARYDRANAASTVALSAVAAAAAAAAKPPVAPARAPGTLFNRKCKWRDCLLS